MKIFLYLFAITFLLIFFLSCSPNSVLYRCDNPNRAYNGFLYDSTIKELKIFLTKKSSIQLKDTIIIKYDYNYETCWDRLDLCEEDYILGIISRNQQKIQEVLSNRQNISVFNFRKPGKRMNKIKKWDKTILIDSTKKLFNLLFYNRCECGSSILIMPDKKFIFIRSDPHYQILDITQTDIEEILKKHKNGY